MSKHTTAPIDPSSEHEKLFLNMEFDALPPNTDGIKVVVKDLKGNVLYKTYLNRGYDGGFFVMRKMDGHHPSLIAMIAYADGTVLDGYRDENNANQYPRWSYGDSK